MLEDCTQQLLAAVMEMCMALDLHHDVQVRPAVCVPWQACLSGERVTLSLTISVLSLLSANNVPAGVESTISDGEVLTVNPSLCD